MGCRRFRLLLMEWHFQVLQDLSQSGQEMKLTIPENISACFPTCWRLTRDLWLRLRCTKMEAIVFIFSTLVVMSIPMTEIILFQRGGLKNDLIRCFFFWLAWYIIGNVLILFAFFQERGLSIRYLIWGEYNEWAVDLPGALHEDLETNASSNFNPPSACWLINLSFTGVHRGGRVRYYR